MLDTRNTKYLHNYAAALAHHDSIKPIRGTNIRPMAERNKSHFDIRKEGEKIIIRLHRTDIVTYTPDNRITLNMGRWNSNSTRAAILAVSDVEIRNHYGIAWVRDHDGKCYPFKDGMQLQMGEGQYRCEHKIIDPVYPVVHKIKRKELSKLRNEYAPFIQYLKGFVKLIGEGGFTNDMFEGINPLKHWERANLQYAKGTHEEMHKLTIWLALLARKGRYATPIVRLKDALAKFDEELIQAHKDTVLTRTVVTDGTIVQDRYSYAAR